MLKPIEEADEVERKWKESNKNRNGKDNEHKKGTRTIITTTITKTQWTNLAESRDTIIYGVIARIIETVGTPEVETRTTATSKVEIIVEKDKSILRTNMKKSMLWNTMRVCTMIQLHL